jgi:large subunit ribosomal protein L17
MRHRRRGRKLGRSPSHQRALLRNLTISLFLTERDHDPELDEGKPPAVKGRIVTTLAKAKEARPMVEKCITIARHSLADQERAGELGTTAERQSQEWKSWRNSRQWRQWATAVAPVVAARRRVLRLLGHGKPKGMSGGARQAVSGGAREAVQILFDVIAPRYADRAGGYTRVLRLSKPRVGDAGQRAVLELVGAEDRRGEAAVAPALEATEEKGEKASASR